MEETRKDRYILRDAVINKKSATTLTEEEKESAEKVCRAFDILGLFDRTGIIDKRHVVSFYACPLVELYENILGNYIEEKRLNRNRGKTLYWEVVAFYKRVKNVPKNHPGITDKDDWPNNPM
ncbi:MAG: hypothetical protein JJV92_03495 [Desulfosarcina sp.]|nr:hypothetical protein [Desulfobacterales bacterium]